MQNRDASPASPAPARRWYHRIGHGLITACVVIGPGSILTSSQVGAKNGYSLAWVVVVAVAFMMVYTALGRSSESCPRNRPDNSWPTAPDAGWLC